MPPKNIDILPANPPERPMTLDEISKHLAELKKKKNTRESLTTEYRENLRRLDTEIQGLHGRSDASTEQIMKLRVELDELSAEVVKTSESGTTQEVPKKDEKKEAWYNPSTWSPETKKRAEAVGWGVGIGAVVIGLAWLWKVTKKKTSEIAKKTGENVSWLYKGITWALGIATAAALGYVGVRAAQEFTKLSDLRNALDKARKEAASLTGEVKAAADARVAAIEEQIKAMEKKSVKEKGKKTVTDKTKAVAARPEVKLAIANLEHDAVARGLLLFKPAQPEWDASESTKKTHLVDILENHTNARMPVAKIMAATSQPFETTDDDASASREQAGIYLWNFCKEHQGILTKMSNGKTDVLLEDFVHEVAADYASVIPVEAAMSEAKGDVLAAMKKVNTTNIIAQSRHLERSVRDYILTNAKEAGFSEEELNKITWEELILLMTTGGGSISGWSESGSRTNEKILGVLYERLRDESKTDVHRYMIPFFHNVLPRGEGWHETQEENLHAIHTSLVSNMPRHQALRFAFYAHLIKKGNPVGIALMQTEVLKFVADEERGPASLDKNQLLTRMTTAMAGMTRDKIAQEWRELNINIDPSIVDTGLVVLQRIGRKALGAAVGASIAAPLETGKTYVALAWDHPAEVAGISLVGLELLRRSIKVHSLHGHEMREALKDMKSTYSTRDWWRDWTLRVRGIEVSDITDAEQALAKLERAIDVLPESMTQTRLYRFLKDGCKALHNTPVWKNMLTFAKEQNLPEIAKLIENFTESPGIRRVIGAQRWLLGGKIPANLLKPYDVVSSAVWAKLADIYYDESTGFVTKPSVSAHQPQVGHSGPDAAAEVLKKSDDVAPVAKIGTDGANAAQEVLQGNGTVVGTARVADAVEDSTENVRAFDKFYEEVRAARTAKDNRKLMELLRGAAKMIQTEAAAGNRTAQAMLLVLRFGNTLRWAGRVLVVLGPLIDAAFIIMNQFDMGEAKRNGNHEMYETLSTKDAVLKGQAVASLGLMALGPAGILAAPVSITAGVVANNIFASVVTWEKRGKVEWLQEEPEALDKALDEIPIGYMNSGHRYGILTHPFARPFVNWDKTAEQREHAEYEQVESVNRYVRQEILTAYFLKTMKVVMIPGESDQKFQDRVATGVRDRLNFIRRITEGTYARGITAKRFFYDQAHEYAELAGIRRQLKEQNASLVQQYEKDGKVASLDLSTLDYVTNDAKKDNGSRMAFLQTMKAYEDGIQPYKEGVYAMQQMAYAQNDFKKAA